MEFQEKQISTKEFLKNVFTFFIDLGKNWQLLFIAMLIGTCFDLIKNSFFKKDDVYTGKITFHLDLEGGGQNQLGGLASSFGLPMGGATGGGGDLLGAANFESIVMSVNVFQNALMREVKIGNRTDLFINYYVDSSDIKRNEWAGSLFKNPSSYATYKFKKKKPEDFTPTENLILSDIYNKISTATRVDPLEGSSLIEIYGDLTNEDLTKTWIETLMLATEEFYKNMKTKKTRQMLKVQESRLDSLSYLLKSTDKRLARITFDNPNVVDPAGIAKQQQVNRDNTYLTTQYLTQLNSVETLNRLLIEQTPIFTILEPVRLPLTTISKTGISTRLSGIICFFLAIIFLTLRKTVKEVMSDIN